MKLGLFIMALSFAITLHFIAYDRGVGVYAEPKELFKLEKIQHRMWANKRIRT